jgi:MinD-like ATPase involved in chromosome partitioning or flagellar assembly
MSLSTSLAEARQLYALLGDIERQLDTTKAKARDTALVYRDLYNVVQDVVVQDVFTILRHAGLPDDQVRAIAMIQRLIAVTHSLFAAINALNVAMATTPAGLAVAGLGVAATMLSIASGIGSFG